jgi:hypothetical protein
MGGWMCAFLLPERLDGFYSYSVFKTLPVIGRFPINMNIPVTKIGALKTQNSYFLYNGYNDFDQI